MGKTEKDSLTEAHTHTHTQRSSKTRAKMSGEDLSVSGARTTWDEKEREVSHTRAMLTADSSRLSNADN